MRRSWWSLALGVLVLLASIGPLSPTRLAHAVNVSVDHGLSSQLVELGDPVTLTLRLSLDEDIEPNSPKLSVPPGFTTSRVNSQSTGMRIFGDFRRDYTARWVLIPDVVGTFEIGPPSVKVGGTKVTATGKLTLKVVGKGQAPTSKGRRGRRRQAFGGLGQFFAPKAPFDLDDVFFEYATVRPPRATGRALKLARARDQNAFLYIHADKTEAMVGEQITLSYWLYVNIDFEGIEDYKEPALGPFTREVISVPAATRGRAIQTSVAGRLWAAKQYGEVAIFPVRSGKLSTGTWQAKVEVVRAGRRQLLPRESNDVVISVTAPPSEGRPLGYQSGTVGRFKIKADVAPRETYAGDTTSVSVQVTGVGKLPSELHLPARVGVEWLKPERKDGVSMVHGNIGGWRTFEYAVRLSQSGEIALGNIELPYWDAGKNKYEVATVELGVVSVSPSGHGTGGAAASSSSGAEIDAGDPFKDIAKPRPTLRPFELTSVPGLSPRTLWAWVLTPPMGVALTTLLAAAARRSRRRRRANQSDPRARAMVALGEVARATGVEDAAAATERALHLAIEARTGLKSRAMLRGELLRQLRDRLADDELADDELADEVLKLFESCSTIRFEPGLHDKHEDPVAARAQVVVKELLGT